MQRVIHHTFGPHVDRAYLRRTLALSYTPWAYRTGRERGQLAHDLRQRFGYDATLFGSGRESLLALLKAHNLPAGSEVIVQGFTCVVVPNAIHAAGLTTVYADIDRETLNLTPETVAAVASPLTRVVLCQHTFGIPSPTAELKQLCDAQGWILIEDCAHVLPDAAGPAEILRVADHAILSFGRDKAISGIGGGAVLTRDPVIAEKLHAIERRAREVPFWSVVRLLEYPGRMAHIVRPLIGRNLAAPLLAIQKLLGLFSPVLTPAEKRGAMSPRIHRMPNVCAALARWQLGELERINTHRRTLAARYARASAERGWGMLRGIPANAPLQKFPMMVPDAAGIRRILKSSNIHLDDGWTGCVVCPDSCDLAAAGYEHGSDPAAEAAADGILSLPTHPTMTTDDADRLIHLLAPLLP